MADGPGSPPGITRQGPDEGRFDRDAEARRAADYVRDNCFDAHLGAMAWQDAGASIGFGDGGHTQDDRTGVEVAEVGATLEEVGIERLGFGVDPGGGYSRSMVVLNDDVDLLTRIVWEAAPYRSATQRPIAAGAVARVAPAPEIAPD